MTETWLPRLVIALVAGYSAWLVCMNCCAIWRANTNRRHPRWSH